MSAARKKRYFFFLNPYVDDAFSRCPKCEAPTKIRKFCLMVCVEPDHFLSINTACRFCPRCELIIARRIEMNQFVHDICGQRFPGADANRYTVFGTMERSVWRRNLKRPLPRNECAEHTLYFKAVWDFETRLPQWVKAQ